MRAQECGGLLQVVEKARAGQGTGILVGCAEDGRWMNRGDDRRKIRDSNHLAVVLCDAEGAAEKRLGGGSAQADDEFSVNGADFCVEPGAAGSHFGEAGLLVDAAFAARLPLEMLNGVSYVDFLAVDAGFYQASVEEQASGANKRMSFDIFTVAGLLADKNKARVPGAFTEDGLRGVLVKGTALAVLRSFAERGKIMARGKEIRGGVGNALARCWHSVLQCEMRA